MTFRQIDQSLIAKVGRRFADELGPMPVKDIAHQLRTSMPTASRIRRGEIKSASILLQAFNRFGSSFACRVLEPVLGPMDDAALASRLDAILAEVGDIRHVVAQNPAALASHPSRRVGAGRGDREGAADGAPGAGGQAGAGLARVQARRHLDEIAGPGRENLRRQIADWRKRCGRIEVDAALAYAKADPLRQTGVAVRPSGSPWRLAHIAERHPFRDAPPDPAWMAREFDATAADDRPWLLDTGATFLADGMVAATANWVCRTIDRARDGTLILIAGFAPKVAA